ncbi:sensor histidine kinase [Couchioplanes caeruleus]|nr:sensor histidine kinase [Couchioplanes caeruleus]
MLADPRARTAYDVTIALVVAYATSFYDEGYDTAIGCAMALAVVFRRRAPLVVMAVVAVLALVQWLLAAVPASEPLAGAPTGYDVAVLVAMVSVVTHAERVWQVYAAGVVGVLGVVVAFAIPVPLSNSWSVDVTELLAVTGLVAGVWLTAFVLRTRRLYVLSLEERSAAAERERAHLARLAAVEQRAEIARELHDVVAHSLAVMILQADGARYLVQADLDRATEALRAIAATGRDALEDMHRIVDVLRGTNAGDAEQDRRPVGIAQLDALVAGVRAAGLRVELRLEGEPRGLSAADETTLYRLAQEGLTNTLRHAGPEASAAVTLRFGEGAAMVEVVDDGGGRLAGDAPWVPGSGGNGLVGMRERVAAVGGRFTAGPRVGPGWQVRAEFPVRTA